MVLTRTTNPPVRAAQGEHAAAGGTRAHSLPQQVVCVGIPDADVRWNAIALGVEQVCVAADLPTALQLVGPHPDRSVLVASAAALAAAPDAVARTAFAQVRCILLTADHALARSLAGRAAVTGGHLLPDDVDAAGLRAVLAAPPAPSSAATAAPAHGNQPPPAHEASHDGLRLEDDWVKVLAHDLRSPLGIINGYAAAMLEGSQALAADTRDLVTRIADLGHWALQLVDRYLVLAELEDGSPRLNYEQVALATLAADVVARLQPLAAERGVRVVLTAVGSTGPTALDRMCVEQILQNLLSNAIAVSAAGDVVQVRCGRDGDHLYCEVADTGRGMSPQEVEHAFAKFSRGSGPHRKGHGLGLAIAKALAALHGGRITVQTAPGAGATFRFAVLPGGAAGPTA